MTKRIFQCECCASKRINFSTATFGTLLWDKEVRGEIKSERINRNKTRNVPRGTTQRPKTNLEAALRSYEEWVMVAGGKIRLPPSLRVYFSTIKSTRRIVQLAETNKLACGFSSRKHASVAVIRKAHSRSANLRSVLIVVIWSLAYLRCANFYLVIKTSCSSELCNWDLY